MSATHISNAMHALLADERAVNRRYREALELIGSGGRNATAAEIARDALAFDKRIKASPL